MADSVDVSLVTTGWTEIQEGVAGFITNSADNNIIYREAAADPTAAVVTGHFLLPKGQINYTLGAGQKVFARALRADAPNVVVVTET
jgi:hypothetical protein